MHYMKWFPLILWYWQTDGQTQLIIMIVDIQCTQLSEHCHLSHRVLYKVLRFWQSMQIPLSSEDNMADRTLLCGLLMASFLSVTVCHTGTTSRTHHLTWSASVSTLYPPRYLHVHVQQTCFRFSVYFVPASKQLNYDLSALPWRSDSVMCST